MMEGKGYDDKKVFKCVCCGKDVLLTKFASALTAKCPECKEAKLPPNPQIVSEIKTERDSKKKSRTVAGNDPSVPDGKKSAKCVQCGKDIFIGKFASAKTCLCDECKGIPEDDADYENRPSIDLSKINRADLPNIDELYVMPQLISNRRLRHVDCPACGHEDMKIIKIIDASPALGLVIVYQCKKCKTAITLSEQSVHMLCPAPMHKLFNYRAEEIKDFSDTLTDVRAKNAIDYMMKLCKDNNIDIKGIDVPEYLGDIMEKEVPNGINDNWKSEVEGNKKVKKIMMELSKLLECEDSDNIDDKITSVVKSVIDNKE